MTPSRSDDERLLEMVGLRSSGVTLSEISKQFGMHTGVVTRMTNNVISADIAHSGESAKEIRERYWK